MTVDTGGSIRWALAALAALAVAACGGGDSLEGTSWHLTDLAEAAVTADAVAALDFIDEERLTGETGCNSFNGTYQTDGSDISVGPLAMTLVACPSPALTAQEAAYLAALESAATFDMSGDALALMNAGGETTAEFERFEPSVVGSWQAISYNTGQEAVTSVILGTEITAVFDAEGEVSGSGGCNGYFGPYEVEESDISVGPLANTERACLSPEGIMEQESQYLAAFQSAATWSIRGANLELRTADGALAVIYAPAR